MVGKAANLFSCVTFYIINSLSKIFYVFELHKHEQFIDYIYIHGIRFISQVIYLLQYFYGSLHWRKIKESREPIPEALITQADYISIARSYHNQLV